MDDYPNSDYPSLDYPKKEYRREGTPPNHYLRVQKKINFVFQIKQK